MDGWRVRTDDKWVTAGWKSMDVWVDRVMRRQVNIWIDKQINGSTIKECFINECFVLFLVVFVKGTA